MSSAETKSLQLDDKVRAESLLYAHMFHAEDKKTWWIGCCIALGLHVVVLIVNFPQIATYLPRVLFPS